VGDVGLELMTLKTAFELAKFVNKSRPEDFTFEGRFGSF